MDYHVILDELLELLNTVNRINRGLVQKEGRSALVNLSAIQMQAVITIRRHGVLNMSDLADRLLVTRPQLTKIIDGLEGMELTTRKPNPGNRREVLIALTDQGNHYIEDCLLGENRFLSKLLDTATQTEIGELREAVRTMTRILAKVTAE